MNKIKYLIHCVKNLDTANMKKIAHMIADDKSNHRGYLFTIVDMIYCGLAYQAGYHDYQEFEFYKIKDKQRKTYLTRGKNNAIIKKYNDLASMPLFDDKGNFYREYNDFLNRKWLDLRKNSFEEFSAFVQNEDSIIVKPADGEGGHGVEKIKITSETNVSELYQHLLDNKQDIVEQVVKQHPKMNELYDKGVNTLRIFSFCDGKKGHVLQSILKAGNNGAVVDNYSSGGMYTFLDENGVALYPAIDNKDILHDTHPYTGTKIVGFEVPLASEAFAMIEKAAMVHPEVGYVGWDVAIGENGPLIIEGNFYPGVFQPRSSFTKDGNGVLVKYKKYMDI